MATMIIFDGVDIQSVAKVQIVDVHVSPISYEVAAHPNAIAPGSAFIRNRCGTRSVVITFALKEEEMNLRQSCLIAVNEWAKSDKEYKLELPGHPNHYLMAVCTEKPSPSLRQWWEAGLRLVFTCIENPFWTDCEEKSVACGTQFRVMGDAEPLMRIERSLSGAASNQSYGLNGNTITFSTIPAGSMVIDLNKQTAVVGNSSIMGNYNVNSRFLIPATGLQTVTGTGTVKWRERWQ
jgi:phage-related protein